VETNEHQWKEVVIKEILVESTLSNTLGELSSQAILCDSEGRALGFFSPIPDRPRLDDLQLEPTLSIAEIEELRKVKHGKPLSEILERLGVQ
jgi:hypothetical protein